MKHVSLRETNNNIPINYITFFFTQIGAHVGAVNDLAFANPNGQLCVVTCGDDKLVKVRNRITGFHC